MRHKNTWLKVLLVCGGVALVAGCGDDDGSTDNNNSVVQNDAGVDAGPDAATGDSLELIMVDGSDADAEPEDMPRLEGVTVAFDLPGGTRVESTSDASGVVTFHGIDWSLGEGALTMHKDGFQLMSQVSLGATTMDSTANPYLWSIGGTTVWFMQPMARNLDSITVTGTATGLMDPGHNYLAHVVTSPVASAWEGGGSASFEFIAPENEAFSIIGVEIGPLITLPSGQGRDIPAFRAMELQVPATAGPSTSVTLDFAADEIPLYTVDASFVAPTRADSPLRDGVPYVISFEKSGRYGVSNTSPMDISADGNRFEGTVWWAEPLGVVEPYTQWTIYHQASGALSAAIEPGYPDTSTPLTPLYDVPRMIAPADPLVTYPLHDPLQWELFDDCPVVALSIQRSGMTVWTVRAPPNATTLTVPQPPSSVNASSFLGTNFLAFFVTGHLEPHADLATRYVESSYIRLSRE